MPKKHFKNNSKKTHKQNIESEKLRKTGIDILGVCPWGTHFCQFYNSQDDLIDMLVPYFKAGLENNEFCMWVTSEPLGVEDAKKVMRRTVPNFDKYLRKGQIMIIPYSKWYLKKGVFDLQRVLNAWVEKLNHALAKGYDGMRVTGNTAWLEKRDWKKFVDYEKEVNNVIGKFRMMDICTYSLDKCTAFEVMDVIKNHQFALIKREGKWEIIESSERKRAEEALRESEDRYCSLVETSPDAIAVHSEGRISFINTAGVKLLGATGPEQLIGKPIIDFLHPDYWNIVQKRIRRVNEGKKEVPVLEEKFIRLDGKVIDVEVTAIPFTYNGKPAVQAVARDITERKKTEKELKEREAFNYALFEHNPVQTIVVDLEGKVTRFNQAKRNSGDRLPNIGDVMYKDYAGKHEIDMHAELMKCIKSSTKKRFPEQKYNNKILDITISSFPKGAVIISEDITERKKVEDELRLHSEVMKNASEGVYLVRASDGIIVYANPKFEKIFGYGSGKMIGKHVSIVNAPTEKDPKETAREIMEHMEKTGTWRGEIENIKKDGSPFWCYASVSMFEHPTYGRVLVAVHTDITERKKVEDALRQSEEKYRNIVELDPDVIMALNLKGIVTSCNKALFTLTGFSRDEIIGRHFSKFPFLRRKDILKYLKISVGLIRDKVPEPFEVIWIHKDGSQHLAEIRISSMKKDNKIVGVQAIGRDITERKLAEEEIANLAKLSSQNPYPVLRIEKKGTLLYANVASRSVLDEWNCRVGQSVPDNIRKMVKDILDSDKKKNFEIKHGNQFLLFSVAPVVDADYVNLYGIDITVHKQTENELRALLREKEVLLKEVHHRVKNNMQVISSLLNLQARYIEDKKTAELFRKSQNRIKSMSLIHEKLYKSMDVTRVDFKEYVRELTKQLLSTYAVDLALVKVDIEIKDVYLDVNKAIPCGLIINELVTNTLKYAYPDCKFGTINIEFDSGKRNQYSLIISDNGVGLPKDLDFRRTKTLGFQLVNTLVEQLNGTIKIDRKGGTTFKIKFGKSGSK